MMKVLNYILNHNLTVYVFGYKWLISVIFLIMDTHHTLTEEEKELKNKFLYPGVLNAIVKILPSLSTRYKVKVIFIQTNMHISLLSQYM